MKHKCWLGLQEEIILVLEFAREFFAPNGPSYITLVLIDNFSAIACIIIG